jgi:ketosteroid isomerase-like protein
MRTQAILLTLLALVAGCSDNNRGREPVLSDRAEGWRLAYNSGDTQKLGSFYAEDARYVSAHVPTLILEGKEAILKNFERGYAGGGRLDTIVVLFSDVSCDLATLVCRYDATNDGVKVSGRNILIMRKSGSEWLITTHASIVRD